MDNSPSKAFHLLLLSLTLSFFLCLGHSSPSRSTIQNHNNMVYRHCPNSTLSHPTKSVPETLNSLFQELLSQSSRSKFHETSVGDEELAISGLFQCRTDLSNDDCHSCVNRISEISNSSSCGEAVPGRIHLSGCYVHYEADGYDETSRLELQHKSCSESKAAFEGSRELREAAFAAVESCVVSGDGFCDMGYESMHVMAQCEGKLEGCDCGVCVNSALEIAEDECGDSVSGEVYLDSCFISYGYYEKGIPRTPTEDYGAEKIPSAKVVAIVVGGAAAVGAAFILLYFFRSCRKQSDEW